MLHVAMVIIIINNRIRNLEQYTILRKSVERLMSANTKPSMRTASTMCGSHSCHGIVCMCAILVLYVSVHIGEVSSARPYRVATKPTPPFAVVDADNDWSGFSIDFIRNLELGDLTFIQYSSNDEIMNAVVNDEADVAIAATTITQEREERVDFSLGFFEYDTHTHILIYTSSYTHIHTIMVF